MCPLVVWGERRAAAHHLVTGPNVLLVLQGDSERSEDQFRDLLGSAWFLLRGEEFAWRGRSGCHRRLAHRARRPAARAKVGRILGDAQRRVSDVCALTR